MNKKLLVSALFIVAVIAMSNTAEKVYAKENSEYLPVSSYEFGEDSEYEISSVNTTGTTEMGKLSIGGNYEALGEKDGYSQYDVKDGQLTLQYSYDKKILDADETSWHMCSDGTKTVDGIELDNKVECGAIIIQTSLGGEKWATDKVITNVFSNDVVLDNPLYTTKDIQLVNGCYYKIIVVYEKEMVTGTSKYWFVETKDKAYKKYANVYKFHAIDSALNSLSNKNLTTKKNLGEKKAVKKDSGFATEVSTDNKDPHYGWELGQFYVNGYTRETTSNDGNPMFLKNVGDRVTLWFSLDKDIDNLDGAEKFVIAEDKNGYDKAFEVAEQNFKHGALIIRYTDYEGKKHTPIVYTDFLAANATTEADTQAVLFEEGDYEVALDYVIKNTNLIGTETDYRIAFKFSVRNGNTMFFPFDVETGDELRDNAVTDAGFKIDMAKSRYLNIDVKRSVIVENEKGHVEDVRFNRPAKDGDAYTDEGIYTVDVTNQYTNEHTTKTFYVGSNPFLVALSKPGMTIEKLDECLANGYTISENGDLIEPGDTPEELPKLSENEKEKEKVTKTVALKESPAPVTTPTTTDDTAENVIEPLNRKETKKKDKSGFGVWIIILCLIAAGVTGAFFYVKKNSKVRELLSEKYKLIMEFCAKKLKSIKSKKSISEINNEGEKKE